jgi:DNA-binding transcriptional LysR family regulator
VKDPAELTSLPLLEVVSQERGWTEWEEWLDAVGVPAKRLKTRRISNYVIAWQAAQDGQGVALGWMTLVAPLLEARKLVTLTKAAFVPPDGTYVSWSAHRPLSAEATTLRDWLMAQAAAIQTMKK